MPLATLATQLKNVSLDVLILPLGVRTPTTAVITVSGGSAGPPIVPAGRVGATSLMMQCAAPNAPLAVRAGTSLSFGIGTARRVHVLVREDVTIAATATSVPIFPLTDEIPFIASPTYTSQYVVGLRELAGVNDFSLSAAPQEVDTTDSKSGFGMESELVRSDISIEVSGIARRFDDGLYGVIAPVSLDGGFFGREIYAQLCLPDGSQHRGAAKVKNLSFPGNPNEVQRYSFTLQYQGSSYNFLPPYLPT